jgi:hypothetical protein
MLKNIQRKKYIRQNCKSSNLNTYAYTLQCTCTYQCCWYLFSHCHCFHTGLTLPLPMCFASPLIGLLFCSYRYTALSIEQASVVPISQHSVQSTKYVKVLISLLKHGQRQCQSSMKAVAMWEQVPTALVSTCTL